MSTHRQTARRRSDPTWPTWRTVAVTAVVIVVLDVAWLVFGAPLVIAIACAVIVWTAWFVIELVWDHHSPRQHRGDGIKVPADALGHLREDG